jgi:hypothetical protein
MNDAIRLEVTSKTTGTVIATYRVDGKDAAGTIDELAKELDLDPAGVRLILEAGQPLVGQRFAYRMTARQSAADYAAQFDREWAAVIEPLIDQMEAEARGVEPDAEAELVNLEEEMELSRQRRRAG